jgi:hypothetical protein
MKAKKEIVAVMAIMLAVLLLPLPAWSENELNASESAIHEEVRRAMANESLFNISPKTGMSPGISDGQPIILPLANAAGSWSLELLGGGKIRQLDLKLFQIGETAFGQGNLTIGKLPELVTAGGYVEGTTLNLYVVTSPGTEVYHLELTVGSTTMAGSYEAYSSTGAYLAGMATGTRLGHGL